MKWKHIPETITYAGIVIIATSTLLGMFSSIMYLLGGLVGGMLVFIGVISIVVKMVIKPTWRKTRLSILHMFLVVSFAFVNWALQNLGQNLYFVLNKKDIEVLYQEYKVSSQIRYKRHGKYGISIGESFVAVEVAGSLDSRSGYLRLKKGGVIDSLARAEMGRFGHYLRKVSDDWYYYNTGN